MPSVLMTYALILISPDLAHSCLSRLGDDHGDLHAEHENIEDNSRTAISYAEKRHTATLIFLHGIGILDQQNGRNWTHILGPAQKSYMKIICPTPFSMSRDLNKRHLSWYYTTASVNAVKGIDEPTKFIHRLINEEIYEGIKPERIIIGGCKQGGVLAMNSAFRFDKKLGGLIIVDSHIPIALRNHIAGANATANKNIPTLRCEIQPISDNFLQFTTTALHNTTHNIQTKTYDETRLLLPAEGVEDVKNFFTERLGR